MNWPSTPVLRLGSIPMLPLEMPPDCVPWCGACPRGFFCQAIAALNFDRLECQVFDAGTVLTGLTLHMFKLNEILYVFVFSIVHFRSRGTCQPVNHAATKRYLTRCCQTLSLENV